MYAVLNLGFTPVKFARLSQREKAFVVACIRMRIDAEKTKTRD
jgi:hypothetical protein